MFPLTTQSISMSNSWQTLKGLLSAVSKPVFAIHFRWNALDEIDQIYMRPYIPLHLLNPIWKPRKALLRSVIRAKNNAPAKKQSDRSDAAGPGGKR